MMNANRISGRKEMIIEKIVAKKNLAATLALALGIALPSGIGAQSFPPPPSP